MHPYFFGTSERPLFGIFSPARSSKADEGAVLLCSPIGHEYMRAHWALRQLADHLTRAGYHVFRFDYSGLGDSWGSFLEATVPQWLDDVGAAAQELLAGAGLPRLSMVGLRLGATLAWEAAASLPIDTLVLWDPVVRGRAYLEELRRLEGGQRRLKPWARPASAPAQNQELLGFAVTPRLLAEIAELDLTVAPVPAVRHFRLLTSAMRPEYQQLHERLQAAGANAKRQACDDPGDWNVPELFAEPLVLGKAMASVLTGLGQHQDKMMNDE